MNVMNMLDMGKKVENQKSKHENNLYSIKTSMTIMGLTKFILNSQNKVKDHES